MTQSTQETVQTIWEITNSATELWEDLPFWCLAIPVVSTDCGDAIADPALKNAGTWQSTNYCIVTTLKKKRGGSLSIFIDEQHLRKHPRNGIIQAFDIHAHPRDSA